MGGSGAGSCPGPAHVGSVAQPAMSVGSASYMTEARPAVALLGYDFGPAGEPTHPSLLLPPKHKVDT